MRQYITDRDIHPRIYITSRFAIDILLIVWSFIGVVKLKETSLSPGLSHCFTFHDTLLVVFYLMVGFSIAMNFVFGTVFVTLW